MMVLSSTRDRKLSVSYRSIVHGLTRLKAKVNGLSIASCND
jgi:hypothetical protein